MRVRFPFPRPRLRHHASPRLVSQSGQGLTEYVVLLALIAVAAIGVVTVFGDNVRALFGASADALAGETDVTVETGRAGKRAGAKSLKDFAKNNGG